MKNTIINKKLFLCFLFISLNFTVWAIFNNNDNPISSLKPYNYQPIDSNYRFIKYKYNSIFQANSSALAFFYSKLDSLRAGLITKVNILHIGDSHIQADLLTDKIRKNFHTDSTLGNGGYGLAYPYAIAKTNNPTWYTSSYSGKWESCRMNSPSKTCNWGIAGINTTTYDVNATFSINLCAFQNRCYDFNKVRIFCDINDSTLYDIKISHADFNTDVLVVSTSIDSVQRCIEITLSKCINKGIFSFIKSNEKQKQFTLKGISLENTDKKGIVYHAIGLNSATAATFMRTEDYAHKTRAISPDLIIISLGTNDAYGKYLNEDSFYRNFAALVLKLKEANPNASIMLTSPADSYRKRRYPNINFTITPRILKAVAREYNCGFWNLQHVMGGYKSINKWHQKKLCQNDKLHFNRKGYELQADLLFDALMKSYSNK
jgi:lysophospholipase L1-like esterase